MGALVDRIRELANLLNACRDRQLYGDWVPDRPDWTISSDSPIPIWKMKIDRFNDSHQTILKMFSFFRNDRIELCFESIAEVEDFFNYPYAIAFLDGKVSGTYYNFEDKTQLKQMALKCPTCLIPLFKINDLRRPYVDELFVCSNYDFIMTLLHLKDEHREITETLNAYLQDKYDEDLKAHGNCHAVAVWENFMRLFGD